MDNNWPSLKSKNNIVVNKEVSNLDWTRLSFDKKKDDIVPSTISSNVSGKNDIDKKKSKKTDDIVPSTISSNISDNNGMDKKKSKKFIVPHFKDMYVQSWTILPAGELNICKNFCMLAKTQECRVKKNKLLEYINIVNSDEVMRYLNNIGKLEDYKSLGLSFDAHEYECRFICHGCMELYHSELTEIIKNPYRMEEYKQYQKEKKFDHGRVTKVEMMYSIRDQFDQLSYQIRSIYDEYKELFYNKNKDEIHRKFEEQFPEKEGELTYFTCRSYIRDGYLYDNYRNEYQSLIPPEKQTELNDLISKRDELRLKLKGLEK
jgi:hypothetical protein